MLVEPTETDGSLAPQWAEWIAPLQPLQEAPTAEDSREPLADESALEECCF
jgi:hypothetical protein